MTTNVSKSCARDFIDGDGDDGGGDDGRNNSMDCF